MHCSNRDAGNRSPRQPPPAQRPAPLLLVFRNHVSIVLCMLAASACATSNPLTPAKEARPVTAESTPISPKLSAEQVLRQLLDAIRDSENSRELT